MKNIKHIYIAIFLLLSGAASCALLKKPSTAFAPTQKALDTMHLAAKVACDVAELPADKRRACAQLKSAITHASDSLDKLEKVYKVAAPALGLTEEGGTAGGTAATPVPPSGTSPAAILFSSDTESQATGS